MAAIVTRWWWIRHAPVTAHGGCIYGQEDYPADTADGDSFARLASHLPAEPVWVTSHLRRTHETAAAILAARDLAIGDRPPWLIEPDIAEQHVGDWHGLTHDELSLRRGVGQDPFALWPASERPPGGESFLDVMARVDAAVARLTAAHRGRDIVAIAHGGSIRAALAIALGIEGERVMSFAIDNCSITRIDHISIGDTGRERSCWRIVAVNRLPRTAASP
ncbi:MAG: histidine phosphatase family protein [Dongiaceae bacterium]